MKKIGKNRKNRTVFLTYGIVIIGYLLMELLRSLGVLSRSVQGQLIPICVYIVLAVSLNLVVGISGELSLGHAGFMGIGAFTGAIAATAFQSSVTDPTVRLILSMLLGGVFSGLMGLLIGIPVLRLQGDYLAIVTLAFGEIIRNIVNNLYVGMDNDGLHFSMLTDENMHLAEDGRMILAGPRGTVSITPIATFLAGIILVLITLFLVMNLIRSKEGRAIKAIRDNRIAAQSVGLHIMSFKLKAFVLSAVLAGAAGALYGLSMSNVSSVKFSFTTSIDILVFVVLGGMGNILGSVISATVLYLLPELMRPLKDARMILYAVVLIVVMLCTWAPGVKNALQIAGDRIKGGFAKLFRRKERRKL